MMKIRIGLLLLAGFLFIASPLLGQKKAKYIGVKRCSMCHKGKKKGEIFEIWKATKHSTAYATLLTEESKEIAKKLGIEVPPEEAPECLECHVTGFGVDKKLFMRSAKVEDGITCETCHGPGSLFQRISVMRDKEKFLLNGGILPGEKECKICHNEKSPTYIPFEWEKDYKAIEHHPPKTE